MLSGFLDMGGYAGFVWPAFGVTAAVLIALLIASLRTLKAREADLDLLQRERRGRRVPADPPERVSQALSPRP